MIEEQKKMFEDYAKESEDDKQTLDLQRFSEQYYNILPPEQ